MYAAPAWLVDILGVVFRNSWQSCVLIMLVLAVQWMFRKHLTVRWRYGLWFLVLIRLAVPFTTQTTFSVFNWLRVEMPSVRSVDRSGGVATRAQTEVIRESASLKKSPTELAGRSASRPAVSTVNPSQTASRYALPQKTMH